MNKSSFVPKLLFQSWRQRHFLRSQELHKQANTSIFLRCALQHNEGGVPTHFWFPIAAGHIHFYHISLAYRNKVPFHWFFQWNQLSWLEGNHHPHSLPRACWPSVWLLNFQKSSPGFLCTGVEGSKAKRWSLWCFLPPRLLPLLVLSRSRCPRSDPLSWWSRPRWVWLELRCFLCSPRWPGGGPLGSGGLRWLPPPKGLCSGSTGASSSIVSSSSDSPSSAAPSLSETSSFTCGGGGVAEASDLLRGNSPRGGSPPLFAVTAGGISLRARLLPAPWARLPPASGGGTGARANPAPNPLKALTCLTQVTTKSAAIARQPAESPSSCQIST